MKFRFLRNLSKFTLPIAFVLLLYACDNPFAPKLAKEDWGNLLDTSLATLGDQTTLNGLFDNFRYAYMFKDTITYGNLLDDNFNFIYRNYDKGIDVSWGRDEDMLTTYRLFTGTERLDLIWNSIVLSIGDSIVRDISRGFNLTIEFSQNDVIRVQGRANFRLVRTEEDDPWKILTWRDESNY